MSFPVHFPTSAGRRSLSLIPTDGNFQLYRPNAGRQIDPLHGGLSRLGGAAAEGDIVVCFFTIAQGDQLLCPVSWRSRLCFAIERKFVRRRRPPEVK